MSKTLFTDRFPVFTIIASLLWLSCASALAAAGDPDGNEFQVNTFTWAHQQNASVAMNAAGGFVVVWESSIQDPGDLPGIYGQRYDATGAAVGGEFQVNSTLNQENVLPKVAMNDTGKFVVVWESSDQDGNFHVYARPFDATGTALSNDQEVSSTAISLFTTSTTPTVAMDGSGNFVVAWVNYDEVNGDEDIYARSFAANGTAIGSNFKVNTTLAGDQGLPALAMNSAGDYVISWQSPAQDGDGNGIYAQLYAAAGTVLKSEFQVNTTTANEQTAPAVGMSADGFVVAWQSLGQDGDGNGIYGQRYDALGTPLGSEFQVNTTTANEQTTPSVAKNGDGFVVAWESLGQDGDGKGIYAQRYDAAGSALGAEFQVNTTTAKDQAAPAVAMNADNASVVAWQSFGQDKSWNGVYAQRYLGNPVASSSGAANASSGGGGGGSIGLFAAVSLVPVLWRRGRRNKAKIRK